jgi:hypothetical protein
LFFFQRFGLFHFQFIPLLKMELTETLKKKHFFIEKAYIHYDARVTLKTYLPVKRIGNKCLVLPGHHNGYIY